MNKNSLIDYLEFTASRCCTKREAMKWHDGAISVLLVLMEQIPTIDFDNLKNTVDEIYTKYEKELPYIMS